ncbi:MAG TPA: NUDIX hydrolase [Terriglobales bacterium]|nr:NUDIX hydrolase [Terriglobales bacterium]
MAGKTRSKQRARVLSSKAVFRGPVFYVTSDRVREPGGFVARRDMVRHPGSVVILAADQSRGPVRVLLARQYRYAAGKPLWELPAGRIDPGEQPLAAAKRELLEETGYTARRWQRALFFYSSPGFLDETMAIYLATELVAGKAQPEEDEVIQKRLFPLSAAVRMVMKGRIDDGKTIAGVLWLDKAWSGKRGQSSYVLS